MDVNGVPAWTTTTIRRKMRRLKAQVFALASGRSVTGKRRTKD